MYKNTARSKPITTATAASVDNTLATMTLVLSLPPSPAGAGEGVGVWWVPLPELLDGLGLGRVLLGLGDGTGLNDGRGLSEGKGEALGLGEAS